MTTTYPLTFPSVGVRSSSFRLRNVVSESQSVYTGATQVYAHQGQWWEGEITFVKTNRETASELVAFLLALRGKFGTFLYGDPDYLALGSRGAGGGTPLVAGGSQTGRTLDVDGFTPLTTVYYKGDYFSLGSGTSTRLYCLTKDATTDSSGAVTLDFEPALRSSPDDDDPLTFTGAKCLMMLNENVAEWNVNESNIYDFSIPIRERLNI